MRKYFSIISSKQNFVQFTKRNSTPIHIAFIMSIRCQRAENSPAKVCSFSERASLFHNNSPATTILLMKTLSVLQNEIETYHRCTATCTLCFDKQVIIACIHVKLPTNYKFASKDKAVTRILFLKGKEFKENNIII